MWEDFLISDRGVALQLDSLLTSHPLSVDLESPTEILQQFDAISYSKGASVIRMLESYLDEKTEDSFNNGLTQYLTTFSYRFSFLFFF